MALFDKVFLPITTAAKLEKKNQLFMLSGRTFSLFSCRMSPGFSKKRGKKGFLSLIKTTEPLPGSFLLGLPLRSLRILPGEWQPAQIYMKLPFKYDIQRQSEM